jgi:hypothetical protein
MAEELNINETQKTLDELQRESQSATSALKLVTIETRKLVTQTSSYIRAQSSISSAIAQLKSPILDSITNLVTNNRINKQQIILEQQRLKQSQIEQAQVAARIKVLQAPTSELATLTAQKEEAAVIEEAAREKRKNIEAERNREQSQIELLNNAMQVGVAQRSTALRINGFGEEVRNMTDNELKAYRDSLAKSAQAKQSEIEQLDEIIEGSPETLAVEKERTSKIKELTDTVEKNKGQLEILTEEEKLLASVTEQQAKNLEEAKTKKLRDNLLDFAKAISTITDTVRKTQQAFGIAAGQAAQLNIGTEIQSALSYFSLSAKVSGEEIRAAISAFQEEFGGVITPEAAKEIASQAKELGVTTSQLAVARRQFMTATMGNVGAAAAQQDKFISEFQKKGLTSKDALDAIAQNSEIFARNGTRFAASFARAAADAKKIGVDLGKIDQIGDNIIGDFEGFLEKTAELGAMGFGFDSQRMAEIAESGDTGALMNELRSQLAQQGKDLTNLRRSEQLALSQAFGIPMAELQRLAQTQTDGSGEQLTEQEKANSLMSKVVNILEKFGVVLGAAAAALTGAISISSMKTALNTSFIASAMGATKGLFATGLNMLKTGAGKVTGMFGKGSAAAEATEGATGRGFLGGLKDRILGRGEAVPGTSAMEAATRTTPPTTPAAGAGSRIEEATPKDPNRLIRGAAAMLIMAGALYVFAKALQEFSGNKVDWPAVGMATVSLGLLTGATIALSKSMASGDVIKGAAGMVIMGGALWVVGKALQNFVDMEFGTLAGVGAILIGLAVATSIAAKASQSLVNPMAIAGLAIFTAAMIGLGFALKLAAPGIEAFGTVVTAVLGGVAGIITAVGGALSGIFSQLKEMSATQLLALGGSLYVMGGGLAALGFAGLGAAVGIGLAAFAVGRLVRHADKMSLLATSAKELAANLSALSNVNTAQLKEVGKALPTAAATIQTAAATSATTPKPITPTEPQPVKVDFTSLEKKLDGVVTAIGRMRVELDGNKVGRVIATSTGTFNSVGVFSRT